MTNKMKRRRKGLKIPKRTAPTAELMPVAATPPATDPNQVNPTMLQSMIQSMAGEFLASTALSRVQSDVSSLRADFHRFTEDVHRVNVALGEFRDKVVAPVQKELEYLRYNLGARTEDSVGALDKLTHHLQDQLELLMKARGLNPTARDAAGESALDRIGIVRDRPDYQTLEREGQVADETSSAPADSTAAIQRGIDQSEQLRRLAAENAELRKGLELDHLLPDLGLKIGETWVDPYGRHWTLKHIKLAQEMNG